MSEEYNPYRDALEMALAEFKALQEQERQIAIRKANVKASIKALAPLVNQKSTDVNSLGLADAIRLVFGGTSRTLSPIEVRGKLEDLGFNLSNFENPLASIHTALNRMVDTNELVSSKSEDNKKRVGAGPELKPVPEVTMLDILKRMAEKEQDAVNAVKENE